MVRTLASLAVLALHSYAAPASGPAHGTLIIVGGGKIGPEIVQRFIKLAGGPQAPAIVIPTAEEGDPKTDPSASFLAEAGMTNVTVLHTRDPEVANSDAFVAPLKTARAVWFAGGRQWRLVDAYLNTKTELEIRRLLDRGGVVGGSSAGATIQGSYLVRGAREGNGIMMAPGYEQGFGLMRGVAIDQHLITRHRENDLWPVIDAHPELLGIGIDEQTAILVHGNQFEVIGPSRVAIYDARHKTSPGEPRYYFLSAGDRFNLKHRKVLPASK